MKLFTATSLWSRLVIAEIHREWQQLWSTSLLLMSMIILQSLFTGFSDSTYLKPLRQEQRLCAYPPLIGIRCNTHRFFSIFPRGNINNAFKVTDEGVVILQRYLDRETVSTYNLTIDAVNTNSYPLKSSKPAIVIIYVEDINDNLPHFNRNSYSAKVLENVPIGHIVINPTAQDKDSGSNGHVTYSLVDSPCDTDNVASEIFSINPTSGAITTSKKLKSSAPQVEYKFQVKASDNGIPSLESFTHVLITVEDANDSPPVFTVCNKLVTVQPCSPQTTLFSVSASDADHGSNANITYYIYEVTSTKTCYSENRVFLIDHDGVYQNHKGTSKWLYL
ncbi:hypothetical protein OS493_000006 [Desmophyllum pertusum]|uniref:Cadherin domain-containing protein n=1 Tax=Desmophyllum pertusum TaxID=174260 RepID=A0A9X0A7G8_9CNID|nr:hypothetical protein OS493_000006 [Desmophyllum pertusum]